MAKRLKRRAHTAAKSSPPRRYGGLADWIEANVKLPDVVAEPGPIRLAPYMKAIADSIGDPARGQTKSENWRGSRWGASRPRTLVRVHRTMTGACRKPQIT
jgi:hypothetical protein